MVDAAPSRGGRRCRGRRRAGSSSASATSRSLDFEDASFDAVVSTRVIINLPSWDEQLQGLRECVRVLRPGGVLPALRGDRAGMAAPERAARRMGSRGHPDAVVQPLPRRGARARRARRRARRSSRSATSPARTTSRRGSSSRCSPPAPRWRSTSPIPTPSSTAGPRCCRRPATTGRRSSSSCDASSPAARPLRLPRGPRTRDGPSRADACARRIRR